MKHAFLNYAKRYAHEKENIKSIVYEVGISDNFILKEKVEKLEKKIKSYTGAKNAIAVSNGTAALMIILKALGVGPGVEVLTPAFSFISSASAIALLGGKPVFVEVDENTGMIDPEDLEKKITSNSRIIIAVHLFSVMADMIKIKKIANKYGLTVVEDSAVSLGSKMNGISSGLLGDIGLYSFFPAKPIGGIGDGGIIITDNDELAIKCRMLRNHGQDGKKRFYHQLLGYNCRMDELVAAFISSRIEKLDQLNHRRQMIANIYNEELSLLKSYLQIPPTVDYKRVYYTYVIKALDRNELKKYLYSKGIETVIYYPLALHEQEAFSYLGYAKGDFPKAEAFSRMSLALPLYPEMSEEEAYSIVNEVKAFYDQKKY